MPTLFAKPARALEAGPARLPEPDPHHALADRLAREFDAPVGLFDPHECIWLVRLGQAGDAFPGVERCRALLEGRTDEASALVWSPASDTDPQWLVIPVIEPGGRPIAAFTGFAPRGEAGRTASPWGPPCPAPALRAWGQEVANRLRLESESCAAFEDRTTRALVAGSRIIDGLIRRLKVSDPPERFQRLAAATLREEIGAAAVAWVPGSPREPVAADGTVNDLPVEAFRALVPDAPGSMVRLIDVPVCSRVYHAAIVAADHDDPAGWLVALSPAEQGPYRPEVLEWLRSVAPLLAAQRSNARLYTDLKELLFGVIRALTSAIDAKDPYTSGHSERVARIAVRLGEQLGMSPNQRGDLYLMGLLHDIGKIGVDDGVLKKPDRLSPEEYRQIQAHVRIGVHILSDLKKLHHLLPGVAHHHESVDGSGYPSGLRGEAIPLAARILAVADAFDAMSSSRPYRRRLPASQIDGIFSEGAGKQWDPVVVEALAACRDDIERIRSKGLGDSLRQVVGDTLGRADTLR